MLTSPELNLSLLWGHNVSSPPADHFIADSDVIKFGGGKLTVIHTPGHTRGCICLYGEGLLISGDTLFAEGVGRTDLPGGNHQQLLDSINNKLFSLPEETVVLPGHGPITTIENEKLINPFL